MPMPQTNYVLSPTASEASDGMSQFSRRKHYNYANVVLEMKKKNDEKGGSYCPQQQIPHQPQQQQQEQRGRSDEGVGTGWHAQFQQHQQQPHQYSSSYETTAAACEEEMTNNDTDNNNDNNNDTDNNNNHRRRRLLQDPYTMNKNRSRSTIRRIADRTVQLNSVINHDAAITMTDNDGDDTSSVFSTSGGGGGYHYFGSGGCGGGGDTELLSDDENVRKREL
jgi:hypothetical protein